MRDLLHARLWTDDGINAACHHTISSASREWSVFPVSLSSPPQNSIPQGCQSQCQSSIFSTTPAPADCCMARISSTRTSNLEIDRGHSAEFAFLSSSCGQAPAASRWHLGISAALRVRAARGYHAATLAVIGRKAEKRHGTCSQ